ncbi:MAG TPA: UbiA family prenyltransferase [Candidatus Saccharimonadales bacterium]|nr:UbiA family prenyltransferase [Candidatus Saccharimonadales bacterium]
MWWDERNPGGTIRSLIFLAHPGPSLLVTLVLVAIAGLAGHRVPDGILVVQLIGAMLPVQFCIGVINDVVDLPADAVAKPHKPLVRGIVTRSTATGLGVVLGAVGLGVAATINLGTLGLDAIALGAGLAYDLGLRRTPLSWVPWWGGMAVLPLEGYAAVGSIPSRLLVLIPLAGLIAIGLHFANALPDIDSDRVAGRRSLPVVVGRDRSAWAGPLTLAAAGVLAIMLAGPLAQAGLLFAGGVAMLGVGVVAVLMTRTTRPFPVLAVATAIFAVAWLASLPRT